LAEETKHAQSGVVSADCFAFSSSHDIVDDLSGLKVCGCALRITDRGALLQASIPYRKPTKPVEEIIAGGISLPISPWRHEEFASRLAEALSATKSL
jgi:lipoate-protein ligase A